MEISCKNAVRKVHACASEYQSPVVLIAEDFSTKGGPIFNNQFLYEYHFPYVKQLADAWHSHGIKVLYHSDGNYKAVIPDLIACNVDGFYCLEISCGMDIVELKRQYPNHVWAGGVDGVDLLERGTPEQVRDTVEKQIFDTNALQDGGIIIASSSEINPPIPVENFEAMIQAVGSCLNRNFAKTALY